MYIQHIDPGNMRGRAGEAISNLHDYFRSVNGVFRSDIPTVKKSVIFSAAASGEIVPKINYVGSKSLINQYMQGQWGTDYAQAIRNADPKYEHAVAKGFAEAAEGHIVTERVQMEVTPPCAIQPVYVSYLRIVAKLTMPPIWRPVPIERLFCFTFPTDDLVQHIWRDKGYRLDG